MFSTHPLPERLDTLAYPTSATTYKLPFDGRIRIASQCRFVLVRWNNTPDARPFIVRRSNSRSRLVNGSEYRHGTDYIIDQVTGLVTYHFNGYQEEFNSATGYSQRTGNIVTRSLRGGQVEV